MERHATPGGEGMNLKKTANEAILYIINLFYAAVGPDCKGG